MDPLAFRLRVFLLALLAVMVLGTIVFMTIEGLSLTDAFYFSLVTIATVGYGDIHPATQMGKIFAIALIITGVGTFLGVVANATEMMLNRREKGAILQKLNMVIGVFFSEAGTRLLAYFSKFDPELDPLKMDLIVTNDWSERDFLRVNRRLKNYNYTVKIQKTDLVDLRHFLIGKRDFLLRLLENPILLEHECFTSVLRAVFHLTEELAYRTDVSELPDTDIAHLSGDIKRAYMLLVCQWLDYMKHLKLHYPYLFSLALRTNPFDREASPIVE